MKKANQLKINNLNIKTNEMKESKRYTVTIIAGITLVLLAILGIFKGMEVVATTAIAGILTILSAYIWGETKRPSRETIENIRNKARREVYQLQRMRRSTIPTPTLV